MRAFTMKQQLEEVVGKDILNKIIDSEYNRIRIIESTFTLQAFEANKLDDEPIISIELGGLKITHVLLNYLSDNFIPYNIY